MVHIFVVCYNESLLLPQMINHYKKQLPSCNITVCDNHSTDDSVQIAQSFGCDVIYFDTNNEVNDLSLRELKNNCWKGNSSDWVIIIDMDEWLCVTENQLDYEKSVDTSILSITGIEMIGESKYVDLHDINLHEINRGFYDRNCDKSLCFRPTLITEINYGCGAHSCSPIGNIKYSEKKYLNKHMNHLGKEYYVNKCCVLRYNRNSNNVKNGFGCHYTNNEEIVSKKYTSSLNRSEIINFNKCLSH